MFKSFLQGGFECSTHRRFDGRRVDVIAATRHDEFAASDYRLLAGEGIRTVRDGLRWHLVERTPESYDWGSALRQIRASRAVGTQVIWDVLHYGWPDDLDFWSAAFVERFAAFAGAASRLIAEENGPGNVFTPVNEISFMAFAAGQHGFFFPYDRGRGQEMKRQLVRAHIAAVDAIRTADPQARFVTSDPVINVIPRSSSAEDRAHAAQQHASQFEALDMIAGRLEPELGGDERYLDVIGVNYYVNNQWVDGGGFVRWNAGDDCYRPFSHLLADVHQRYGRPLVVSETGIEADARVPWLRMMCDEALNALSMGLPLLGLCLYPVMNHPGWDDERHCPNGLVDYDRENGVRSLYMPLAKEMLRQRTRIERALSTNNDANDNHMAALAS